MRSLTGASKGSVGHTKALKGICDVSVFGYQDKTTLASMKTDNVLIKKSRSGRAIVKLLMLSDAYVTVGEAIMTIVDAIIVSSVRNAGGFGSKGVSGTSFIDWSLSNRSLDCLEMNAVPVATKKAKNMKNLEYAPILGLGRESNDSLNKC